MTRKDTILIAVVINAGLLAILFTTAIIYDADKVNEQIEFTVPLVENNKIISSEPPANLIAVSTTSTGDEVDNVLKYYNSSRNQAIEVQLSSENYAAEPLSLQNQSTDDEELPDTQMASTQEQFIEVKVKRGDVLEKIAKVHKTTVEMIKKVNHLENERLSIGQTLKIPVKQQSQGYTQAIAANNEVKIEIKPGKPYLGEESVYYIVKSGDNPWKIAKQFGVKYDEILRLNNLDEEKARNLKIGDRIRVK